MRLSPELAQPTATLGSRQVLGAVARRATLLGAAALGGALVTIYAGGALTLPSGHPVLTAMLASIAAAQAAWVTCLLRFGSRPPVLVAGAVLQLGLAVVWVLSRTVGLPGQGVVPVTELDVLCLLDELVLLTLALSALAALSARIPRSGLRALAPCQLAVTLAGATLFAWGGGHVHSAAANAAADAIQWGAPAHVHYFCHLL